MSKLQLQRMVLGMVGTNCYLAMNRETRELIVIDPADETARILAKIEAMGGKAVGILLTHGHFDHMGASDELAAACQIPVCILAEEEALLGDPKMNASLSLIRRPISGKADRLLRDGEVLEMAGFQIRVLHTPGHTQGGACYYIEEEKTLFSGDTLFFGSIGRTDLPTGSMREILQSLKMLVEQLSEDTAVYPGHGDMTEISYEKRYNPYL